MLSSIIGESEIISGRILVPKALDTTIPTEWIISGSIAYVAQTPWLENTTIKDNILFGLIFQPGRYQDVIKASALRGDLEILPDGDMTEIGARGINLSGGQRWRVSLARAFYSRASILVFDDIFSAMDTHVGQHIFELGIMGQICYGRTRIIATHHTGLCMPEAACVVELKDGRSIVNRGILLEQGPGSFTLLKPYVRENMKSNKQTDSDRHQTEANVFGDAKLEAGHVSLEDKEDLPVFKKVRRR